MSIATICNETVTIIRAGVSNGTVKVRIEIKRALAESVGPGGSTLTEYAIVRAPLGTDIKKEDHLIRSGDGTDWRIMHKGVLRGDANNANRSYLEWEGEGMS